VQYLEDRIRKEGKVFPGEILKVDGFLNHQMDIEALRTMAAEFKRLYSGENVTKILTIEASGIGLACMTGEAFGVPVLFAKKTKTHNISGDVYRTKVRSYTTGNDYEVIASKEYLLPSDSILIIDDFLANGSALTAMIDLVRQAGAVLVGAGIAVEKAFQPGGDRIRAQGIRVESLARIKSMSPEKGVEFC
jgi:xanthine phosphoribosyltransferase